MMQFLSAEGVYSVLDLALELQVPSVYLYCVNLTHGPGFGMREYPAGERSSLHHLVTEIRNSFVWEFDLLDLVEQEVLSSLLSFFFRPCASRSPCWGCGEPPLRCLCAVGSAGEICPTVPGCVLVPVAVA